MNYRLRLALFPGLLWCCLTLAVLPVWAQATPIRIAAGTTLVADIVNDLGQGFLTATTLMPAAACPGHTDLRASDLRRLHEARAIILHDWQAHLDAVMGPIKSEATLADKVRFVEAPGNWLVPQRQQAATLAVAQILAALDPPHAGLYRERAKARAAAIARIAKDVAAKALPLKGLPVMADVQQKPLLAWFGCQVAAEYGRFEETGPERLARAVAAAKAAHVRLVIDNLQSSGGAGKTLAEDLDAAYAVLSNFPGAFDNTPTWATTIAANLERCLAALARHGR